MIYNWYNFLKCKYINKVSNSMRILFFVFIFIIRMILGRGLVGLKILYFLINFVVSERFVLFFMENWWIGGSRLYRRYGKFEFLGIIVKE